MGFRIDQYGDREVIYVAVDPDGVWARSDFPDELITLDYNAQGRIIGIELVGSAAQHAANALLSALLEGRDGAVRDALEPLVA